jgi:hypothetical protein
MRALSREETLEKVAALEAAADLGKILSHKWHSHIAGGLAEHRSPADFPREDLIKGMIVEQEHTNDPSVACEIAMDHLMEDPHYYNHEQDMAKEVRDKVGHVQLREDGAIKLAEALGIQLAGMHKEAFPSPMAALKSVGSKLLGKAAPKAVGAIAHGAEGAVARGAEGAVGKVLPFKSPTSRMGTMGGQAQHSISGLERTNLDLRPAGASPSAAMQTVRPGSNQAARPVGQVQHVPIQNAVQNAVGQPMARMNTTAHNANLAQRLQEPLGEGRRIGADEWIKQNPAKAQANMAAAAKMNPTQDVASRIQAHVESRLPPPVPTSPGRVAPAPYADPRVNHLLEHGTAAPAHVGAPPATTPAGSLPMNLRGPDIHAGPATGSSFGGEPGFQNAPGHVVPNEGAAVAEGGGGGGGPTEGSPPGTVQANPDAPGGPQVNRHGMLKAMGLGAAGLGAYGLYKGVPAAARMIDRENSGSLSYGDGYPGQTNFGYGQNRFGEGMPTMGAG